LSYIHEISRTTKEDADSSLGITTIRLARTVTQFRIPPFRKKREKGGAPGDKGVRKASEEDGDPQKESAREIPGAS